MTRTVDDVIADVRVKASGRTRFEGQEPYWDELLVAEIDALRAAVRDAREATLGSPDELTDLWRERHAAVIARAREGRG